MQKSILLFLIVIVCPPLARGQRIDHTASYRSMGDRYARFYYDNDFFSKAKTDYYYTQGYSFEVASPALRKNPLSKLLLRYKDGPVTHGLAFEHFGFTPTSIRSTDILLGDRPFAGVILLKSFALSVDTVHRQRLASVLSTGLLGPAAFAGRMQATIHRWSGDVKPSGWQYQIGNDVAINYELTHEKQLLAIRSLAALSSFGRVRLGTLSDQVQGGFTLVAGRFHSPFLGTGASPSRAFQLYAFTQLKGSIVGYDASLQGGVFNQNNPYTLSAKDINRFTFQNTYGLEMRVGGFAASYTRSYLSREFKSGRDHRWGGISLGIEF